MQVRRAFVAAAVSGVLACSALATAAESTTDDVRVGSFNISNVSFDTSAGGDHRTWRERRAPVAAQILGQRLDVVGLQEANQSMTYGDRMVSGANQYLDLLDALNDKGGNYALTNTHSYNCVKPSSTYRCVVQDREASGATRIAYDTDTVTMVSQGAYQFRAQTAGKSLRFLAWSVMRMKATGKQFLFTNTHLDPYSIDVRIAQYKEIIAETNRLAGSRPVIGVGDYNTSKFSAYAGPMLSAMKSNGYGDVLNQAYQQNPIRYPRAEATRRGWVNSFNAWRRDGTKLGYSTDREKAGNNIDWVFASNRVRVRGWEVVVDMNTTTLQLQGVIPSDHNLVRATVVL